MEFELTRVQRALTVLVGARMKVESKREAVQKALSLAGRLVQRRRKKTVI